MRGVFNDAFVTFFYDFLYKSICCYSFELLRLVKAIHTRTLNKSFYKEVNKSTWVVI